MGCAGATGVLTPNLDELASEGVRFSRVELPGSAVHARACVVHDRALRARSRRVHELGRDRAVVADVREGAPRRGLPHDAARQGAPLQGRRQGRAPRRRHGAEAAGARLHRGASRPATSSRVRRRTGTPTRCATAACSTCTAGTSRTAATRARTRPAGARRSGCRCGTRRRCRCRSTPTSTRGTAPTRCEWIEADDHAEPFFLFVGFPGPHDPWDAPQAAVDRYAGVDVTMPATTRRPDIDGTGRVRAACCRRSWTSRTPRR